MANAWGKAFGAAFGSAWGAIKNKKTATYGYRLNRKKWHIAETTQPHIIQCIGIASEEEFGQPTITIESSISAIQNRRRKEEEFLLLAA